VTNADVLPSNAVQADVEAALKRFIDHAIDIRSAVDLTGASRTTAAPNPLARRCLAGCAVSGVLAARLRSTLQSFGHGYLRPCAGASIAIDDRFEIWDSGYISVPFNFQVRRQYCVTRAVPC